MPRSKATGGRSAWTWRCGACSAAGGWVAPAAASSGPGSWSRQPLPAALSSGASPPLRMPPSPRRPARPALPFLGIVLLRIAALREALLPSGRHRATPEVAAHAEEDLPIYSVLVPLYREVRVLPGLVQALQELDYPRAKLDILLVLEASDL